MDAELYYCILRSLQPKRVVEIGSGFSTLVAMIALEANAESGASTDYRVVDPFPAWRVVEARHAGHKITIDPIRVQDVPIESFDLLEAGDILFIDSTHVASLGSDVCYELLEVLPRLHPGVYIHFHDIFLPEEYPREWISSLRFWNEQYLLQAFLAYNSEFEILFATRWLTLAYPDELHSLIPSFDAGSSRPGSFWIRRVESRSRQICHM